VCSEMCFEVVEGLEVSVQICGAFGVVAVGFFFFSKIEDKTTVIKISAANT